MQDEGLSENEHQLSVAGKIKKHFNTSPRVSDTPAGVSVISVSYPKNLWLPEPEHRLVQVAGFRKSDRSRTRFMAEVCVSASLCVQMDDSFSLQRSGSLDFYQHPAMYWIRYARSKS